MTSREIDKSQAGISSKQMFGNINLSNRETRLWVLTVPRLTIETIRQQPTGTIGAITQISRNTKQQSPKTNMMNKRWNGKTNEDPAIHHRHTYTYRTHREKSISRPNCYKNELFSKSHQNRILGKRKICTFKGNGCCHPAVWFHFDSLKHLQAGRFKRAETAMQSSQPRTKTHRSMLTHRLNLKPRFNQNERNSTNALYLENEIKLW